MLVGRKKFLVSAGVVSAVVSLTGCQQKMVESFAVSSNGSVTIAIVSTASYDDSAGSLTVLKPDPAKLLIAARKGTHAFVGPGVSKPVFRLVRLSKHVLQLTVSQKMTSLALFNKHGNAFDPASLSLDVEPVAGTPVDPQDPFGAKGPRTEKVVVAAGGGADTSSADTTSDTFHLTHVGHSWNFLVSESAKEFAEGRKAIASLTATAKKEGLSPNALVIQIQVKLPGKIVSTNGKRLAGGVVSWDAVHLTSRKLSLVTKD